ncbi:hypothetical protein SK128_016778 [Halocaridina rubra]|uniref:Chitin-binding type-2 domain-containing protein n=1 Tax=Halocaridina rubra TaxID=373956 RepID=A0AAN9A7A3_HALRR
MLELAHTVLIKNREGESYFKSGLVFCWCRSVSCESLSFLELFGKEIRSMKKLKCTLLMLLAVTRQFISCEPIPQFRHPAHIPQHRIPVFSQPSQRERVIPPPSYQREKFLISPPKERENYQPPSAPPGSSFFSGPEPHPPQSFTQQPLSTEPAQALSPLTLGQLPLEARPEFDNPDFTGPSLPEYTGSDFHEYDDQEEQREEFVPTFTEDEQTPEEGNENNQEEVVEERGSPVPQSSTILPEVHEPEIDHQEVTGEHREALNDREVQSHVTEVHHPVNSFEDSNRFEEQESQDIEFLSAPPQSHRRQNPAPRSPVHPNQIPVYRDRTQAQIAAIGGGGGIGTRQFLPNYNQQQGGTFDEEVEEDEEEEEPDRLSILLQNSKFSCVDKNNGYYADEEVQCEVFHYCQDRVKHSWLCPEGASFHQVHLICMPQSEDNICERSSTFHFVNDYLYKEIEGPNKTYADRYYPEGFQGGAGRAGARPETIQGSRDTVAGFKPTDQQHNSFPSPSRKRRPVTTFQDPIIYQPTAEATDTSPGHLFFAEQDDSERVHQATPSFHTPDHFPGQFDHQEPSFQAPHHFQGGGGIRNFASFHAPEEVRVGRPRPIHPQFQQGRRQGVFNRPIARIG